MRNNLRFIGNQKLLIPFQSINFSQSLRTVFCRSLGRINNVAGLMALKQEGDLLTYQIDKVSKDTMNKCGHLFEKKSIKAIHGSRADEINAFLKFLDPSFSINSIDIIYQQSALKKNPYQTNDYSYKSEEAICKQFSLDAENIPDTPHFEWKPSRIAKKFNVYTHSVEDNGEIELTCKIPQNLQNLISDQHVQIDAGEAYQNIGCSKILYNRDSLILSFEKKAGIPILFKDNAAEALLDDIYKKVENYTCELITKGKKELKRKYG